MDDLQLLIELIAKSLVDNPEAVSVKKQIGEQTILLSLNVDKSDLGKVIGKSGATATAIRTIAKAVGARLHKRYHLDIIQ